ncbi:hypothetical protein G6F31_021357 [Rhizopus arrhizus]|nr:hypothetical protein G6F31_021357 [Rhizopus arrhizus]
MTESFGRVAFRILCRPHASFLAPLPALRACCAARPCRAGAGRGRGGMGRRAACAAPGPAASRRIRRRAARSRQHAGGAVVRKS